MVITPLARKNNVADLSAVRGTIRHAVGERLLWPGAYTAMVKAPDLVQRAEVVCDCSAWDGEFELAKSVLRPAWGTGRHFEEDKRKWISRAKYHHGCYPICPTISSPQCTFLNAIRHLTSHANQVII